MTFCDVGNPIWAPVERQNNPADISASLAAIGATSKVRGDWQRRLIASTYTSVYQRARGKARIRGRIRDRGHGVA